MPLRIELSLVDNASDSIISNVTGTTEALDFTVNNLPSSCE